MKMFAEQIQRDLAKCLSSFAVGSKNFNPVCSQETLNSTEYLTNLHKKVYRYKYADGGGRASG